jgi:hypothetical protein
MSLDNNFEKSFVQNNSDNFRGAGFMPVEYVLECHAVFFQLIQMHLQ